MLSPGELIGICNDIFAKEMCLHHLYAVEFCERLNAIAPEDLSDVLREDDVGTSKMVDKALEEFFPETPEASVQTGRY